MSETFKFVAAVTVLLLIGIAGGVFAMLVPDKWERAGWGEAVVVKICPRNTPVVRLPNGEIWVRLSWATRYRVENEKTVCAGT
jgi:hypothetical protein